MAGKSVTTETLPGMWRLVSVETERPDGTVEHPFGKRPIGTILYLTGGTMAVHISGSDEAAGRIRAYGGRWRIEGENVVHMVEASLEPKLRGVRLERRAELKGNQLTYRTLELQGPGRPVVVWRRVP